MLTKKLLFEKTILLLTTGIMSAVIFTIVISIYTGNIEKKNHRLQTQLAEIQSLAGEVIQIKSVVVSKEKKLGLRKTKGVVTTLEQILKTMGLRARVIKPLGKSNINEYREDNAELEIHDTDLNSIVNLLYKIDVSPVPMKIKSTSIKSTFEDPEKFILKLTVSLINRG